MIRDYKGLYRSSDEGVFAGICAGLAHKFNLSEIGLRIVFIFLGFCQIGIIIYFILWLILKPVPTKSFLQ